ncbi:hypothetical protein VFPPC_18332 [Pochonia chlamydosporia 170]|uniref:Uncharacterized protein n=1 Tax=Pochonia chlamydosporia 170 TaxID=1380566 RepID=A0A219ANV3_METCM|nr:hypothetical protein VFPPC_18332 [Pochonia chlamydosporia 170]OWT42530.1 hypothetical protein VFPPC_18332 [Pochonia chlamydosporia 170]
MSVWSAGLIPSRSPSKWAIPSASACICEERSLYVDAVRYRIHRYYDKVGSRTDNVGYNPVWLFEGGRKSLTVEIEA